MNPCQVTETELRRLLDRYREAELLKAKEVAINPYSREAHRACRLADRRYVTFHKAAQKLFGHSIDAFSDIHRFMEVNG